jgi:hypothetical protein
MDLFAVRFKLTVCLVNLHLHWMAVQIFAGCHLGGLWQRGLNGFLPCPFSLSCACETLQLISGVVPSLSQYNRQVGVLHHTSTRPS